MIDRQANVQSTLRHCGQRPALQLVAIFPEALPSQWELVDLVGSLLITKAKLDDYRRYSLALTTYSVCIRRTVSDALTCPAAIGQKTSMEVMSWLMVSRQETRTL